MPVEASAGHEVVPIARDVLVEGAVTGRAIALQFTGAAMNYLIVSASTDGPPRWVGEHEIRRTMAK